MLKTAVETESEERAELLSSEGSGRPLLSEEASELGPQWAAGPCCEEWRREQFWWGEAAPGAWRWTDTGKRASAWGTEWRRGRSGRGGGGVAKGLQDRPRMFLWLQAAVKMGGGILWMVHLRYIWWKGVSKSQVTHVEALAWAERLCVLCTSCLQTLEEFWRSGSIWWLGSVDHS